MSETNEQREREMTTHDKKPIGPEELLDHTNELLERELCVNNICLVRELGKSIHRTEHTTRRILWGDDEHTMSSRSFPRPLLKWERGGIQYGYWFNEDDMEAVLIKRRWSGFMSSGTYWELDRDKMIKRICEIIKEALR
jgi:hypothetical protein